MVPSWLVEVTSATVDTLVRNDFHDQSIVSSIPEVFCHTEKIINEFRDNFAIEDDYDDDSQITREG